MLTKQEMEDIWNNKPIDYLKNIVKKNKNLKKYKVTFKPYSYTYHDEITATVMAKNSRDAEFAANRETNLYDTLHAKYGVVNYKINIEEVR